MSIFLAIVISGHVPPVHSLAMASSLSICKAQVADHGHFMSTLSVSCDSSCDSLSTSFECYKLFFLKCNVLDLDILSFQSLSKQLMFVGSVSVLIYSLS